MKPIVKICFVIFQEMLIILLGIRVFVKHFEEKDVHISDIHTHPDISKLY